jgi:hypothetical protein
MKRARPKEWSATELVRLKGMVRCKFDAKQICHRARSARWISQEEVARAENLTAKKVIAPA